MDNEIKDQYLVNDNEEEVYLAIKEGNVDKVKGFLANSDNDENNIKKNSYLNCAIHCRNLEIMKLLLDKGAIIKEFFNFFLYINKDILKLLLSYNVDLEERNFKGETYLHLAVKNHLLDIVDILINKGADVNARTVSNQTILQMAFQEKNEVIINRLLQSDFDVCAQDQIQDTPLHYAVNFQNLDFIKIIIKKGANVDITNKFGLAPLHLAVLKGNIEVVKLLLEHGANVNSRTLEKRVPLHLAIATESVDITKLLLKNGAKVDDCTDNGLTPLHIAVDVGNQEIVMILINNNANVNAVGMKDETPLHIAVAYEHEQITECLISNGAIVNHGLKEDMILHMAVFNKNENLVKLLLNNGADVTVKYNDCKTALHVAVDNKCSTITEMLLNKGAEINEKTSAGNTVLHSAIENEDYETINILFKYNPNINIKNNQSKTPLYISTEKGFLKIVKKLLNFKPDITENKSVLEFAVRGKEIQYKTIVLELLAYGFSIDYIKSCNDSEAFDFLKNCVANGHSGILEYLLKCDLHSSTVSSANPNKNCKNLLHLAVRKNQLQNVKLLLNYGSDVNQIDEDGHSPIFYAVKYSFFKIIKLLLENKAIIDTDYKLFFMVISKGNHNIIQMFLKRYDNVNVEDEFGTTALHFAAWNGDEETIQLLFEKGAKSRKCNNLHQINFDSRLESDICDYYGEDVLEDFRKNVVTTPLHIAARKNYSDILEALLEHGFDVNSKDGCGRTPLHIASLFNSLGVIDVLMEFNADLYATDESGYNCFAYAHESELFISNIFLDKVFIFIHDMDDTEDQTNNSIEAFELLLKYLARQHAIKGVTDELFIKCYTKLYSFCKDCNIEIEALKNETVINNITLYNILTKNMNTLALYIKNEKFLFNFESKMQNHNLRLYSNIINTRIRRAKERRLLLNEVESYVTHILCLPNLLICKILSYLNNRDLRCIKKACKF